MGGKILVKVPFALDVINWVVQLNWNGCWQVTSIRSKFHRLLSSPFLNFESTGVVCSNLKMSPTRVILFPGCAHGHALLLNIAGTILMMDNASIETLQLN